MQMEDLVNQFVSDLDFDVLVGWCDIFGIDHEEEMWLDDDWPDKDMELRGELADKMFDVGNRAKK